MTIAGETAWNFPTISPKLKFCRSVENQCWRLNNFLLDEEKFKFLVHSEAGVPWLAGSDQEISKLVEDVTKAGGFYPDKSFTILTNISVQCQGREKWEFLSTKGSDRFPTHFSSESSVTYTGPYFSFSSLDVKKHFHR